VFGVPPVLYYLQHRSVPEDRIYRLMTVLIIATAGVNVVMFGLMSQAILRLVPSTRPPARTISRRVHRVMASAGAVSLLVGVALMLPSFVEWIRTSHITWHWSWFAAGGTLILCGLQLSIWFVLLAMAHDLASRPDRVRHDSRLD
jgi:hypothetical protein